MLCAFQSYLALCVNVQPIVHMEMHHKEELGVLSHHNVLASKESVCNAFFAS